MASVQALASTGVISSLGSVVVFLDEPIEGVVQGSAPCGSGPPGVVTKCLMVGMGFFGHQEVGEAEAGGVTVFLGEVRFVEQVQKLPQMDRLGARGVNTGGAAGPLELGAQA